MHGYDAGDGRHQRVPYKCSRKCKEDCREDMIFEHRRLLRRENQIGGEREECILSKEDGLMKLGVCGMYHMG